jgi:cell division protein FtsL
MTKLNFLLLLALLGSCLWQVKTAYEARQLFAALDKAREERQQLDAEFKRLDAEAQKQGAHVIVDRVARERLRMRPANAAVIKYVTDGDNPAMVSSAPVANSSSTR